MIFGGDGNETKMDAVFITPTVDLTNAYMGEEGLKNRDKFKTLFNDGLW